MTLVERYNRLKEIERQIKNLRAWQARFYDDPVEVSSLSDDIDALIDERIAIFKQFKEERVDALYHLIVNG